MRRAAAILGLLLLAGPARTAQAAEPEFETIRIDVGHTAVVCTGFCPIYVVTARSDERIELAVRSLGWADSRPSRVRRWRGRRGDFEHMRSILAPLRPTGERIRGEPCIGDLCLDARPFVYILSWNGPSGRARLVANPMPGDQEVGCRVSRAVLDLGIRVGRSGLFRRDDRGRGWPLRSDCDEALGPARRTPVTLSSTAPRGSARSSGRRR